jgi:hypothetical protein
LYYRFKKHMLYELSKVDVDLWSTMVKVYPKSLFQWYIRVYWVSQNAPNTAQN